MLIYGIMKFVEYIPERYDRMMDILTFGNHSTAHDMIISNVKSGMKVLDIGCGTGSVSIKCAEAGAEVYAIDASPQMLSVFKKKIKGKDIGKKIKIFECGSASVGNFFKGEKFDVIIMSLMLGELPKEIRLETLKASSKLIKKNSVIIISDELWPENPVLNVIYYILFGVFFIPNFLLTRTLMRPVKNLKSDIESLDMKIKEKKSLFLGVQTVLKIENCA